MYEVSRRIPNLLFALTLPIILLVFLFFNFQQTLAVGPYQYRVAKTGDGSDGLTWPSAFTDVQDALSIAVSGDEIWVATGVYTPELSTSHSFHLVNGVGLFGGFAATETLRTERNWETNITILSGDLGENNSNTVVTSVGVSSTTILDGFTITGGRALTCMACDGFLEQCYGGGLLNDKTSSPTLNHLIITNNYACIGGGGMANWGGNPSLNNVTFSFNTTDGAGGGMFNIDLGIPVLSDVVFFGNTADSGGGMANYGSKPELTNVELFGNRANFRGGGISNNASHPSLVNVKFFGNSADDFGGAIFNEYYSNPIITNVTLYGNSSGLGGGMYNQESYPKVYNTIFWMNHDDSGTGTISATISHDSSSTITLTHSLVQGSGGSASWIGGNYINGGNNIDTDPLFLFPPYLQLSPHSPAVDAGENSYVTGVPFDLDGNPRIMNGIVDMGVYETFVYNFLPLILR